MTSIEPLLLPMGTDWTFSVKGTLFDSNLRLLLSPPSFDGCESRSAFSRQPSYIDAEGLYAEFSVNIPADQEEGEWSICFQGSLERKAIGEGVTVTAAIPTVSAIIPASIPFTQERISITLEGLLLHSNMALALARPSPSSSRIRRRQQVLVHNRRLQDDAEVSDAEESDAEAVSVPECDPSLIIVTYPVDSVAYEGAMASAVVHIDLDPQLFTEPGTTYVACISTNRDALEDGAEFSAVSLTDEGGDGDSVGVMMTVEVDVASVSDVGKTTYPTSANVDIDLRGQLLHSKLLFAMSPVSRDCSKLGTSPEELAAATALSAISSERTTGVWRVTTPTSAGHHRICVLEPMVDAPEWADSGVVVDISEPEITAFGPVSVSFGDISTTDGSTDSMDAAASEDSAAALSGSVDGWYNVTLTGNNLDSTLGLEVFVSESTMEDCSGVAVGSGDGGAVAAYGINVTSSTDAWVQIPRFPTIGGYFICYRRTSFAGEIDSSPHHQVGSVALCVGGVTSPDEPTELTLDVAASGVFESDGMMFVLSAENVDVVLKDVRLTSQPPSDVVLSVSAYSLVEGPGVSDGGVVETGEQLWTGEVVFTSCMWYVSADVTVPYDRVASLDNFVVFVGPMTDLASGEEITRGMTVYGMRPRSTSETNQITTTSPSPTSAGSSSATVVSLHVERTVIKEGGLATALFVSPLQEGWLDVSILVSDSTEGVTSPLSFTFSPETWTTPQLVLVQPVDDSIVDGPITFSVIVRAGGVDHSIEFTNLDNDGAGVELHGLAEPPREGMSPSTLLVTLASIPSHPVEVLVRLNDTSQVSFDSQLAVATTTVTFEPEVMSAFAEEIRSKSQAQSTSISSSIQTSSGNAEGNESDDSLDEAMARTISLDVYGLGDDDNTDGHHPFLVDVVMVSSQDPFYNWPAAPADSTGEDGEDVTANDDDVGAVQVGTAQDDSDFVVVNFSSVVYNVVEPLVDVVTPLACDLGGCDVEVFGSMLLEGLVIKFGNDEIPAEKIRYPDEFRVVDSGGAFVEPSLLGQQNASDDEDQVNIEESDDGAVSTAASTTNNSTLSTTAGTTTVTQTDAKVVTTTTTGGYMKAYNRITFSTGQQRTAGSYNVTITNPTGGALASDWHIFMSDCTNGFRKAVGDGSDEDVFVCTACPAGAKCLGASSVVPVAGYWTSEELSPSGLVQACPLPADRCLEGGLCLKGYRGTLCSLCENDYFAKGRECVSCGEAGSGQPFLVALILIAVFLIILMAALPLICSTDTFDTLMWILFNAQTCVIIGWMAPVGVPDVVVTFYHWASFLAMDMQGFRLDCSFGSPAPSVRITVVLAAFLINIIPPLVVFPVLGHYRMKQFRRRMHRTMSQASLSNTSKKYSVQQSLLNMSVKFTPEIIDFRVPSIFPSTLRVGKHSDFERIASPPLSPEGSLKDRTDASNDHNSNNAEEADTVGKSADLKPSESLDSLSKAQNLDIMQTPVLPHKPSFRNNRRMSVASMGLNDSKLAMSSGNEKAVLIDHMDMGVADSKEKMMDGYGDESTGGSGEESHNELTDTKYDDAGNLASGGGDGANGDNSLQRTNSNLSHVSDGSELFFRLPRTAKEEEEEEERSDGQVGLPLVEEVPLSIHDVYKNCQIRTALSVLKLWMVVIVKECLILLNCRQMVDGSIRLVSDMDMECFSGSHMAMSVLAIMILCLVMVTVCELGRFIRKHRESVSVKGNSLYRLSFLYNDYAFDRYEFFVFDSFVVLTIVALSIFAGDDVRYQAISVLVVCLVAVLVGLGSKAFVSKHVHFMYTIKYLGVALGAGGFLGTSLGAPSIVVSVLCLTSVSLIFLLIAYGVRYRVVLARNAHRKIVPAADEDIGGLGSEEQEVWTALATERSVSSQNFLKSCDNIDEEEAWELEGGDCLGEIREKPRLFAGDGDGDSGDKGGDDIGSNGGESATIGGRDDGSGGLPGQLSASSDDDHSHNPRQHRRSSTVSQSVGDGRTEDLLTDGEDETGVMDEEDEEMSHLVEQLNNLDGDGSHGEEEVPEGLKRHATEAARDGVLLMDEDLNVGDHLGEGDEEDGEASGEGDSDSLAGGRGGGDEEDENSDTDDSLGLTSSEDDIETKWNAVKEDMVSTKKAKWKKTMRHLQSLSAMNEQLAQHAMERTIAGDDWGYGGDRGWDIT